MMPPSARTRAARDARSTFPQSPARAARCAWQGEVLEHDGQKRHSSGASFTCRLRRMPSFAGHRGPAQNSPLRVMLPPPVGATRRRPPPTSCSVAAGDLRAMGRRWKTRRRAVATMVKRARPEGSPRHGHGSSHSRAVAWLRARIWEEQALAERVRWWAAKHLPPSLRLPALLAERGPWLSVYFESAHAQLRWSPWPCAEFSTPWTILLRVASVLLRYALLR